MRTYRRIIQGVQVQAYNDSNAEWVVQAEGRTQRFDKRKWGMTEAMSFVAEQYSKGFNQYDDLVSLWECKCCM